MSPPPTKPQERLVHVMSAFRSSGNNNASSSGAPTDLGTLRIGDLSIPIRSSNDEERLPLGRYREDEHASDGLLDWRAPWVAGEILWSCQKIALGQDIFFNSPPGPFARRLALTLCRLLNRSYEIVVLHRDIGEGELKQGREVRKTSGHDGAIGTKLVFIDSAVVRAAKEGKILILDGIERCERGVLPLLNNLLENREMNLEDGTHLVAADRFDLMLKNGEDTTSFIPVSRDFRVIAIGTPVPPFPGYPLDPPFRSRFQARYLDPLTTSQILANARPLEDPSRDFTNKLADAIQTLQITKEMRSKMASGISSTSTGLELPSFPQTTLLKLAHFLSVFPPPLSPSLSSPSQFAHLLLSLHPALSYTDQAAWKQLETAMESAGLGDWSDGISDADLREVAGEHREGIWGWNLIGIKRTGEREAELAFERGGVEKVSVRVPAGPKEFETFPVVDTPERRLTPRFEHLLISLLQLHALKIFDISILPPSSSLQSSSSSTTLLISTFASLLGYELETLHLYKEIGGRELWMRRVVQTGGLTSWEPSLLTKAATSGKLLHLEGIDTIGQTAGSLGRILMDRESELWEGKRLVGAAVPEGPILSPVHPSFRIIATSSKSSAPREWLTEELNANFISLTGVAMSLTEEKDLLLATGCQPALVDQLETFARSYRRLNSAPGSKSRRLGTASLVRISKRLARYPTDDLYGLLHRTLLSEFLPSTNRVELDNLFDELQIRQQPAWYQPPIEVSSTSLVFPAASDPDGKSQAVELPLFDLSQDPEGRSHIPYVGNYLNNSQQSRLMLEIATDLDLGEHILLLGNQGVGKNKIVDRLMQLWQRPIEYIQLHRDSTVQNLQYQTSLDAGEIRYIDSPLLRAVQLGRVIVIDEVDKAAAPVVAALRSLAQDGELSLSDGRKVRPATKFNPNDAGGKNDITVHPNFRLILLANRPGFPFLGNPFLRVLGDAFSTFAISNPDLESETRVLSQLAPDLDAELLRKLAAAFGDLRKSFESGKISYPFSLRELIAIVRHLAAYSDSLTDVLRNVFDFDVNRTEVLEELSAVLRRHNIRVERLGIDAVRGTLLAGQEEEKKSIVVEFEPKGDTSLTNPKEGDFDGKQHVGGNKWAGGTGGRDTAGMGGRGGYKRQQVSGGGDIHQIPDALKADVPPEVREKAREMARAELAKRLAEIDLTNAEASTYSGYHSAIISHVNQVVTMLDNLEAKEEERVWLKRQQDGELDESRLPEGLTGESAIYKRRGQEKPELGAPQLKPKRIRFVFDLSASMFRNAYNGGLTRSLECAVLILEAFSLISRKEKYRVDIYGHSGEEKQIPLVKLDEWPSHEGDRFRVIKKMSLIPQYCWAGDHTLEAIEAGVEAVVETDADDYFVIVITDANLERYGITADDLREKMNSNAKVSTSLIAIGEGAEAEWLPRALPGKAHRVKQTSDIATTLRTILSSMLGGEL